MNFFLSQTKVHHREATSLTPGHTEGKQPNEWEEAKQADREKEITGTRGREGTFHEKMMTRCSFGSVFFFFPDLTHLDPAK